MPIYIVRWPREEVSLVRAQNEEHLCDILDEVTDPGCARWAVYNGPLWVDLDLPMLPWKGDGHKLEVDVQAVADGIEDQGVLPYRASPGDGETADEMTAAITKWALPHLQAVVDQWHEAESQEGYDPAEWREKVAAALTKERSDMASLYRERKLHAARTLDPATKELMRVTGVSIEPTWAYDQTIPPRHVGKAMTLLTGRPKVGANADDDSDEHKH